MKFRTLPILVSAVSLVGLVVVTNRPHHTASIMAVRPLATSAPSLTTSTSAPVPPSTDAGFTTAPRVIVNGRTVPVKPNGITSYNSGNTHTTITSQQTGVDQTSSQNGSSAAVSVTQTNNGGSGSSYIDVTGGGSINISSSSSITASGSNAQVTPGL